MLGSKKYIYLFIATVLQLSIVGQNIDSLKLALKNAKDDTTRCVLLHELSNNAGEDEWPKFNDELYNFTESKLRSKSISKYEYKFYNRYLAISLSNYGFLASVKGDIAEALNFFNKSLKIQEEIGDDRGIALSVNNLGFIYQKQGDIPKALEYYHKSLKIHEGIGEREGISSSLNNIAFIYDDLGELEKSLEFYNRCLKMDEESGDKKNVARTLNNMGSVFKKQGNLSKALQYYEESLKIQQEVNDKQGIARSLNNIGNVYDVRGELGKATEYYTNSLKILEEVDDKLGIARALSNLGNIALYQKNYEKALEYSDKVMNLGKMMGFPEFIRDAAKTKWRIYKTTNNSPLALKNYELFILMRDSLNNIEAQKAAIKQQTKYDYEKQKAIEDEKHASELKFQDEKSQAEKKKQNIITLAISVVLLLVAIFSILLFNRFKTTQKQKTVIEEQKQLIEEKHKEITDSIKYAKRIQKAHLPSENYIRKNLNRNKNDS